MPSMKQEIKTVEVEGISVDVDLSYVRSWPGLILASKLGADDIEDSQKAMAMIEYYRNACPNIKAVWQSIDTDDDKDVNACNARMAGILAEAIKDASGKN